MKSCFCKRTGRAASGNRRGAREVLLHDDEIGLVATDGAADDCGAPLRGGDAPARKAHQIGNRQGVGPVFGVDAGAQPRRRDDFGDEEIDGRRAASVESHFARQDVPDEEELCFIYTIHNLNDSYEFILSILLQKRQFVHMCVCVFFSTKSFDVDSLPL